MDLSVVLGPTVSAVELPEEPVVEAKVVSPLQPYEMPPWIRRFDRWLALVGSVVLVSGLWLASSVDRVYLVHAWLQEFVRDFAHSRSGEGHWTSERRTFDPVPAYLVVSPEYIQAVQASIDAAGVRISERFTPSPTQYLQFALNRQGGNRREFYVTIHSGLVGLSLVMEIGYWPGAAPLPAFSWSRGVSLLYLYHWHLFVLISVGAVGFVLRQTAVLRYRNRREREYLAYEEARTKSLFDARTRLDEARKLWQHGEVAKALVEIDAILRQTPAYSEARELKRLISRADAANTPVLSAARDWGRSADAVKAAGTVLLLRVLGTPYAYEAPPGAERITLGRQRPRSEQPDIGNDVVIRVPGSDERSRRISRRHLVIERIDEDYFVRDKSGGHTLVDGRLMQGETPVRIRSGAHLTLADVVTLEVAIRSGLTLGLHAGLINASSSVNAGNGVQFEATIGNMYTLDEGQL